ncbi:MAG: hypothetical protein OHK0046_14330 [Anaerolineae bacterium]
MHHVQMNLLENALDYFNEAVVYLLKEPEKPSRNIKYVILHLFGALELVLKQIRVEKDPQGWKAIVIPTKRFEITVENFLQGKLKTIYGTDNKNIEALQQMGIGIDEQHERFIKQLKDERNNIEHFAVHLEWYAANDLVLKIGSLILSLIESYVPLSYDSINQLYERAKANLHKIERFVEHRIQEIQPELDRFWIKEKKLLVECPECGHKALPLGENARCVYCRSLFVPENAQIRWASTKLWVSYSMSERAIEIEDTLGECPDCEAESFVVNTTEHSEIPADYFCFSCGKFWYRGELQNCFQCGRYFDPLDGLTICPNCLEYKINESD